MTSSTTGASYGQSEWDEFVSLVKDPPAEVAKWSPKQVEEELELRGWKGQKAARAKAYHQTMHQAPPLAGPSTGVTSSGILYADFNLASDQLNKGFPREVVEKIMLKIDSIQKAFGHVPAPKRIIVVEGIRRCGKTFVLRQIIDRLLNKWKVPQREVLYHEFQRTEAALDIASVLKDAVTRGAKYLILDEIQYIQNYDSIVRNINDRHNGVQIILCGSTTGMASVHQLVGRCDEIVVRPFSFLEFQDFLFTFGCVKLLPAQLLLHLYLRWGGFPLIVHNLGMFLAIEMINEADHTRLVTDAMIFFSNLFDALVEEAANLSHEDLHDLKSIAHNIYNKEQFNLLKQTSCLNALEKVYLISPYNYIDSSRVRYYAPDVGLLNFMNNKLGNKRLFEHLYEIQVVFSHLRALHPVAHIYLFNDNTFVVNSTLLLGVTRQAQASTASDLLVPVINRLKHSHKVVPSQIGVVSLNTSTHEAVTSMYDFLSSGKLHVLQDEDLAVAAANEKQTNVQDLIIQVLLQKPFFEGVSTTSQLEYYAHQISSNLSQIASEEKGLPMAGSTDKNSFTIQSQDGHSHIITPKDKLVPQLRSRLETGIPGACVLTLPFQTTTINYVADLVCGNLEVQLKDLQGDILCELFAVAVYLLL